MRLCAISPRANSWCAGAHPNDIWPIQKRQRRAAEALDGDFSLCATTRRHVLGPTFFPNLAIASIQKRQRRAAEALDAAAAIDRITYSDKKRRFLGGKKGRGDATSSTVENRPSGTDARIAARAAGVSSLLPASWAAGNRGRNSGLGGRQLRQMVRPALAFAHVVADVRGVHGARLCGQGTKCVVITGSRARMRQLQPPQRHPLSNRRTRRGDARPGARDLTLACRISGGVEGGWGYGGVIAALQFVARPIFTGPRAADAITRQLFAKCRLPCVRAERPVHGA